MKLRPAVSAPNPDSLERGTLVRIPNHLGKPALALVGAVADQNGGKDEKRFLVILQRLDDQGAPPPRFVEMTQDLAQGIVSFGKDFEFRFDPGSADDIVFDQSIDSTAGAMLLYPGAAYYDIDTGYLAGRSQPAVAVIKKWQLYLTATERDCDPMLMLEFNAGK